MTDLQTKKWQDTTRGGYPVRIYNEDANIHHHIHGAMDQEGGDRWYTVAWNSRGQYHSGEESSFDLLPIKKKKRVFKTLDELADEYSIVVQSGEVYIQPTHHVIVRQLCGKDATDYLTGGHSLQWIDLFTKEVECD